MLRLGIDEPALDAKGHKSPPVEGEDAGTYGWRASVNLGQYDSARAAVSPEAMSYFASAVYFDDWYWASGSAKKEAEKDAFDFDPVSAADRYCQAFMLTMARSRLIRRALQSLLMGLVELLLM